MFQTPIALFIFNRPSCTKQLVDAIAVVKPARLFVIADGPRNNNDDDIELCAKTRDVIDRIDWPCAISKQYAQSNIGCRDSIPSGLHWVFEQVDECIILEDDCIPQPSFFFFCEELLTHYKNDEKIMTIGGHRSDGPNEFGTESYFFSKYPSVWGWATWKEKWAKYDLQILEWNKLKDSTWLLDRLQSKEEIDYWSRMFDKMREGLDTWDYALVFSCWLHNGLSIRPKVNMISNIGFDKDATHTSNSEIVPKFAFPTDIEFPLCHPAQIHIDDQADNRIEWVSFSGMDKRILADIRVKINESR